MVKLYIHAYIDPSHNDRGNLSHFKVTFYVKTPFFLFLGAYIRSPASEKLPWLLLAPLCLRVPHFTSLSIKEPVAL